MVSPLPDPTVLLSIIDVQSRIAAGGLDVPAACDLLCRRAVGLTGAEAAILRLEDPAAEAVAGSLPAADVRSRLRVVVADGRRAAGTLEVQARWPDAFEAVQHETLLLLAGVAGAEVARARAFARALHSAHEDPLTGLPDRRAFDQRLGREVARALRYGRPLALVIVAVDGLAEIRARHGEHGGDDALLRVAHALLAIRSCDEAFRIAPDEFAVLAPETDAGGVGTFGVRLRERIRAQGSGVPVAVTIGAAQAGAADPRRLEADARAALAAPA